MKSFPLGNKEIDTAKRLVEFEKLTIKIRAVIDDAIDGGTMPRTLFGPMGAALTYCVLQTDWCDHVIERTLENMMSEVIRVAAETREATEGRAQ